MLSNQHFIYELAMKDVDGDISLLQVYFDNINKKMTDFKKKDEFWEREDLMKELVRSTNKTSVY